MTTDQIYNLLEHPAINKGWIFRRAFGDKQNDKVTKSNMTKAYIKWHGRTFDENEILRLKEVLYEFSSTLI